MSTELNKDNELNNSEKVNITKEDSNKVEEYSRQVNEYADNIIDMSNNQPNNNQINNSYSYNQPNYNNVGQRISGLDPAMSVVLSIFLPGLPQAINGQLEKGLLLLLVGPLAIIFIAFITCGFGAIISPVYILFSALDAYHCAKVLESGRVLQKFEFHIFS